jgi:hypothetical protein
LVVAEPSFRPSVPLERLQVSKGYLICGCEFSGSLLAYGVVCNLALNTAILIQTPD